MKFRIAAIAAVSILACVGSAEARGGGWHGGGWHGGGWHGGWGRHWGPGWGYGAGVAAGAAMAYGAYGYAPYAYGAYAPYAYAPGCTIQPRRVVNKWGQLVVKNVQVCY